MGADDAAILLQVDQNSEALLAGSIDNVDSGTSIFYGLDRSGKPSVATKINPPNARGNRPLLW